MAYIFTLRLSLRGDHCVVDSPDAPAFQKEISLNVIHQISRVEAPLSGKDLFNLFFDSELRTPFEKPDVKQLVILSDNDLLLRLKWEYLNDNSTFVLPTRGIALLRIRQKDVGLSGLQLGSPPLRILLTTSALIDKYLEKDIRIIKQLETAHPLLVHVTVEKNISPARLVNRFDEANLRAEPYHLWHHCGIALTENEVNPSLRFLQTNLFIRDVNEILTSTPSTKMVFLHLASGDPTTIALSLNRPIVIGLRQFHNQQMDIQWLSKFYSDILVRSSIWDALIAAQTDIYQSQSTNFDWAAPVLVANTRLHRFFDPKLVEPLLFKRSLPSEIKVIKTKRILFLGANPKGTETLRINREMETLEEMIKSTSNQVGFELIKHGAVRYFDLSGYLMSHESQIVHFAVHTNDTGDLLLEDEHDEEYPITPDALGRLLKEFSSVLRLVVFNACSSYEHATTVCQDIECSVSMGNSITDDAALKFTRGFYISLFSGKSVASAFRFGCAEIGLANRPGETDTPQLLTRDGVDASKIRFV